VREQVSRRQPVPVALVAAAATAAPAAPAAAAAAIDAAARGRLEHLLLLLLLLLGRVGWVEGSKHAREARLVLPHQVHKGGAVQPASAVSVGLAQRCFEGGVGQRVGFGGGQV
jgi:hypothetical protein